MEKVGFLLNRLEDRMFTSGGEKVNFLLIKAFFELGYIVDVHCNSTQVEKCEYIKNIYVNNFELFEQRSKSQYYKTSISENFAEAQIDYIHENSRVYRDEVSRTRFEQIIKFIFSHKRFNDQQKHKLEQKINLQNTNRIFAPSTIIKNDLIKNLHINPDKITVISPPVVLDEKVEKKINKTFTFGLVARGFEIKGGLEFLIALVLLKLLGKNFKAKIILPQAPKPRKRFLIKSFLILCGMRDMITPLEYNVKIEEFFAEIDCLVLSSKREAFGLVGAEAMNAGLPVVLNSRCGLKDYITDGQNGFIYNFNCFNIFNLTKKLNYVLENQDQLDSLKENAKSTAQEFTFEKFKNKIEKALSTF